MSPKWLNLVCGELCKTQFFRKFRFLKAVMPLGYPKCILGKFRIFLKISEISLIFLPHLVHFLQGFWNFYEPKVVQSDVWETLKNPNFEKMYVLKVVMVLGCPRCILGKFRMFFEKFLNVFYFFTTPSPLS